MIDFAVSETLASEATGRIIIGGLGAAGPGAVGTCAVVIMTVDVVVVITGVVVSSEGVVVISGGFSGFSADVVMISGGFITSSSDDVVVSGGFIISSAGVVMISGGFIISSAGVVVVISGGVMGFSTEGASGGATIGGAEVLQPLAMKTAAVTANIVIKLKTRFFILTPPILTKFKYTHLIITCVFYAYNTQGREIIAIFTSA